MDGHDGMLIRVQAEWNGWRYAEVRLRDLQSVHWFQPSQAPHPLVHGYTSCTNLVTGDIPHHCDPVSLPHRLLVCILKRHSVPSACAELVRRASEQQTLPPTSRVISAGTSEIRSRRVS